MLSSCTLHKARWQIPSQDKFLSPSQLFHRTDHSGCPELRAVQVCSKTLWCFWVHLLHLIIRLPLTAHTFILTVTKWYCEFVIKLLLSFKAWNYFIFQRQKAQSCLLIEGWTWLLKKKSLKLQTNSKVNQILLGHNKDNYISC